MQIDPIHAGPVALAHAMLLASRAPAAREARRAPLQLLAQWWRQFTREDGTAPDPAQLMLWSECAGRHYVTALGGILVMTRLRNSLAAVQQKPGNPPLSHG
jgi:hypothetical protein